MQSHLERKITVLKHEHEVLMSCATSLQFRVDKAVYDNIIVMGSKLVYKMYRVIVTRRDHG